MYERRLEHSLYRTTADLQRLRLLRQIAPPEETPTPSPAPAEKTPPHRAKQTQSQTAPTAPNRVPKRSLRPQTPITPPQKQTQFLATSTRTDGRRPQTFGLTMAPSDGIAGGKQPR
jgi:hypothetical protein